MTYKAHKITQTATVHANSGRRLCKIEGRYSKEAAKRPFITSQRDAREWINEQITADEIAADQRNRPNSGGTPNEQV